MRYFKVTMGSLYMCGFDCDGAFAAENEQELETLPLVKEMEEDVQEYIQGWVDEDDFEENDDADAVTMTYEEITEAEYLEFLETNDGENFSV